jgi:hypothetical protein
MTQPQQSSNVGIQLRSISALNPCTWHSPAQYRRSQQVRLFRALQAHTMAADVCCCAAERAGQSSLSESLHGCTMHPSLISKDIQIVRRAAGKLQAALQAKVLCTTRDGGGPPPNNNTTSTSQRSELWGPVLTSQSSRALFVEASCAQRQSKRPARAATGLANLTIFFTRVVSWKRVWK